MNDNLKELEEFVNQYKDKGYFGIKTENIQAIENLIARNKKLEEHHKQFYSGELLTAKQGKYIEENYIPKSKVREKIEELKNEIKENRRIASRTGDRVEARILNDQINELYKAIKILEELLQEGDK